MMVNMDLIIIIRRDRSLLITAILASMNHILEPLS